MNIYPYLVRIVGWWHTEVQQQPQKHTGPACIMAATTTLIAAIWGKHYAAGFVVVALVSYPFMHYQVRYLMFLDVHETFYAVAVVAIQIFCRQFPTLSQWGLPLSIAMAYSFTTRGMRIRHILQEHQQEIGKLTELNHSLEKQTTELKEHAEKLRKALEELGSKVLKKKELVTTQNEASSVVIHMQKDTQKTTDELKRLTELCQNYINQKGIQEQLQQMDINAQRLEEQASTLESKNQELEKVISNLEAADQKFNELIAKAQQNEKAVQQALKQFHEWLLSINSKKHQVHS